MKHGADRDAMLNQASKTLTGKKKGEAISPGLKDYLLRIENSDTSIFEVASSWHCKHSVFCKLHSLTILCKHINVQSSKIIPKLPRVKHFV